VPRVSVSLHLVTDQAAGGAVNHQPQTIAARGAHLDHLGTCVVSFCTTTPECSSRRRSHDLFDTAHGQATVALIFSHHAGRGQRQFEAFAEHAYR